jgi:hypothetical protein
MNGERSQGGVFTHPDDAALVDPLSDFVAKREHKCIIQQIPSFPLAEERVVEQSNDRVSIHRAALLLTPTTLRWSTLSTTS